MKDYFKKWSQKSKKLEEEQIIGTVPNGRDYWLWFLNNHLPHFYFLPMVGLLITSYANSQNIRVEANFSPSTISSSSRSSYKIVIHGTQQNPQGQLLKLLDWKFRIILNPYASANFINGVPSVRVELTFQVQPERVGQFTIPSWNLLIEGKEIQVPDHSSSACSKSAGKASRTRFETGRIFWLSFTKILFFWRRNDYGTANPFHLGPSTSESYRKCSFENWWVFFKQQVR